MIWFTSDTHFNHKNIVQYSSRPFADLEEMTYKLILNWNERVAPGDTIFHLGDFSLTYGSKSHMTIDNLLGRLSGQKWLITGNHDRKEVKNNSLWHKVVPYHEIKVDVGTKHKQRIVMFHYAMRVWNQMHRGAIHLYGHSHNNLPDIGGKTMDVGVDANNYAPISLDEVLKIMKNRPTITYDHHEER